MNHSKLGASSSSRWLACPASVKMQEGEKDSAGQAAAKGTAYHALGEKCLKRDKHPREYAGYTIEGFEVDQDMISCVGEYFDYVMDLAHSCDDLMVEQRLSYTNWVPNGFGTADAIVIENGVAHVCDLKTGNIAVSAVENSQGQLYALGVMQEYEWLHDIDLFIVHIIQPTTNNYSEWSIKRDDLLKFGEYAKTRAALAEQPEPPFGPSAKACQWCKAQGSCKALAEHNLKVIGADFDSLDDVDLIDTCKLDSDQIAQILPHADLITGWLKAMQDKALDLALFGSMPGYKAVAGRSIRKWGDEEAAENFLRKTRKLKVDQAYTKKLISPTQAEKLLGKKDDKLKSLIVKPVGKPTLAPESDKRPALDNSDDFDNLS